MITFPLGRIVAIPEALERIAEAGTTPASLLDRHSRNDWGDLDRHDWQLNDTAVRTGEGRIFSSYILSTGKIWVITESDRSSTCLLCPHEY